MTLVLDERRVAMLEQFGIRWTARAVEYVEVATPDLAPALEPVRAHAPPGELAVREVAPRAPGVELLAWDALEAAVAACRACRHCGTRRNAVFGAGDPGADWLIVGDPPNEQEDLHGQPFAGQAGKLLDNMLRALGLSRETVYISNVLKCRPTGDRNPEPEDVAQCEPFLRRQVELLQPKVIVAMGRFAVQALLGTNDPLGKLRGQRHEYAGVPVVVTYHPAALLRNLPDKAKAWADLCLARELAAQAA
jgi:uracil-DNA glycosylase